MRRAVATAALVAAGALAGCHQLVTHSRRNAPGHIDVMTAPDDLSRPMPEPPADPGEHYRVLSLGALGGGGVRLGGTSSDDVGAVGLVDLEASWFVGESERSHFGDDFFFYPRRAWGVNLGWNVVDNGPTLGPIYAEVQVSELPYAVAGGLTWDPGEPRRVGMQVTGATAGLFVRLTAVNDRGVDVIVGLALKVPRVWVWSR